VSRPPACHFPMWMIWRRSQRPLRFPLKPMAIRAPTKRKVDRQVLIDVSWTFAKERFSPSADWQNW